MTAINNLVPFAELLCCHDSAAIVDLRAAVDHWEDFYRANLDALNVDLNWLKKVWGDKPRAWELIIDIAYLHHYLFEADWREEYADIVNGLQELKSCNGLEINWDLLAETDPDTPMNDFMQSLAAALAAHGKTLVILDKESDSYPLAVLDDAVVADAAEFAKQIEDARLVIVSQNEID